MKKYAMYLQATTLATVAMFLIAYFPSANELSFTLICISTLLIMLNYEQNNYDKSIARKRYPEPAHTGVSGFKSDADLSGFQPRSTSDWNYPYPPLTHETPLYNYETDEEFFSRPEHKMPEEVYIPEFPAKHFTNPNTNTDK